MYIYHREDRLDLTSSNYASKTYDCCEYVKYGEILCKIDILLITA